MYGMLTYPRMYSPVLRCRIRHLRLREQLQQPGNRLRSKINSVVVRIETSREALGAFFAVEELRHTLHHFQPLVPGATEVSGSVFLRATVYAGSPIPSFRAHRKSVPKIFQMLGFPLQ